MSYIHGFRSHPLYMVWRGMKTRCGNKNYIYYKDYGGRGISVCLDWLNNPRAFIQWALSHGWKKGLYLDRKDNDGNYSPDNCRFIDKGLSSRNQRLLYSNNTSGYRGVGWDKRRIENPYISHIGVNGKLKHLGSFPSPGLAALRYDAEAYLLNDGRPMNFIN